MVSNAMRGHRRRWRRYNAEGKRSEVHSVAWDRHPDTTRDAVVGTINSQDNRHTSPCKTAVAHTPRERYLAFSASGTKILIVRFNVIDWRQTFVSMVTSVFRRLNSPSPRNFSEPRPFSRACVRHEVVHGHAETCNRSPNSRHGPQVPEPRPHSLQSASPPSRPRLLVPHSRVQNQIGDCVK